MILGVGEAATRTLAKIDAHEIALMALSIAQERIVNAPVEIFEKYPILCRGKALEIILSKKVAQPMLDFALPPD